MRARRAATQTRPPDRRGSSASKGKRWSSAKSLPGTTQGSPIIKLTVTYSFLEGGSSHETSLAASTGSAPHDPKSDPLVVWLNGGPGTSSFVGFFGENGPYTIVEEGDDCTLRDNPFSWNTRATYLMIDQPAGVGLSSVADPSYYAQNEDVATGQLYRALLDFFADHPEYAGLDLYLFGESFAGHYLPTLATAILTGDDLGASHVNLRGIGVGDGWVDPLSLQKTYAQYAYSHGLVALRDMAHLDELYDKCRRQIERTLPIASSHSDKVCNKIEEHIGELSGGINVYDVRRFGEYDFSFIGRYLDQPGVRETLHVDPSVGPWVDESPEVAAILERGEQGSSAHLFPRLFDRLRVLVYNGVFDMDCNFMGTDAWLEALEWTYAEELRAERRRPGILDDSVLGWTRVAGNVRQVLVANAGHLVPMDCPQVALTMLDLS
jgi:carboxypeptidase C (cathepsin A)